MQRRRLKAPGPALVISLIALFVALGGTAFAAISLPKDSVGSKQLKKGAVTSVKIAKGAVTNAKIAGNAVTGAKVENDSLTGADILESSLGKVPSAGMADSATTATNAANSSELGGIAASGYQQRVTGTCPIAIDAIASTGSVTCENLVVVEHVSPVVTQGNTANESATCPAGDTLVGGGGGFVLAATSTSPPEWVDSATLGVSGPGDADGNPFEGGLGALPQSWHVGGTTGVTGSQLEAYAVCAS